MKGIKLAQQRPLTQREIKKAKAAEEGANEGKMTVYNPSQSRMIPIQIRDPKKDFFVAEQTIQIGPQKTFTERKSFFNMDQIKNLTQKGDIRVVNK